MDYRLCGACLNFARHDEPICPFCGHDVSAKSRVSTIVGAAAAVGVGLALAACGGVAIVDAAPDGGSNASMGGAGGAPPTGGMAGLYGAPPYLLGGSGGVGGAPPTGGMAGLYGTPPYLLGGSGGVGGAAGCTYGCACVPETDIAFCARLGKNCGTVTGADNCGTVRTVAPCGVCPSTQSCGGSGTPNVCSCSDVLGRPGSPCTVYPAYPGFTLALVEDFDMPLDLATDPNWTYSDGIGDYRYTRFKKEAISFSGGKAIITATAPAGDANYPSYAEGDQSNYPVPVTGTPMVQSGELRSKYNNWRYGRFEARIKVAKNINAISGFFTFRTPKWQDWRELDIEVTPANPATSVGTNIVWAQNAAAYDVTRNSYSPRSVPTLAAGASMYDDFHTYALENLPTKATWYVDGTAVRTETGAGVSLPDKSMKISFNLWVFPSAGWGGGNPASNVYPMHSEIDWVRLYQWNDELVYPCRAMPSCLPAEDRDYSKNNAEDGIPTTTSGL